MKIAVISYSLTGNNEALAKSIAEELQRSTSKLEKLNLGLWVQLYWTKFLTEHRRFSLTQKALRIMI